MADRSNPVSASSDDEASASRCFSAEAAVMRWALDHIAGGRRTPSSRDGQDEAQGKVPGD